MAAADIQYVVTFFKAAKMFNKSAFFLRPLMGKIIL